MSKDLSMAVLLDLYGSLLTEKQLDALDLYYNQDFSLSEIAENDDISRQGVRDAIKRGEKQLIQLEEKLGLKRIQDGLDKICEAADRLAVSDISGEAKKLALDIKSTASKLRAD